jgi:hypothetical protein
VQFDGYDITDAQFPPREWLPQNITLDWLDILAPVLEHLQGRYDIVSIRFFGLVIRHNEHVAVFKNLVSMLSKSNQHSATLLTNETEPGGYIQWLEVDLYNQDMVTATPDAPRTAADTLMRDGRRFLDSIGVSYKYVPP